MKILVDATTWAPGRSGIGLYTERLLRALHALDRGDELLLATNRADASFDVPSVRVGPNMPIRALWLQTAMAAQGLLKRPDVAFYPNYVAPLIRTCPTVITVHDMAVFLYPETFTFKKRVLQRALLPTLVRRAAAVLTPSESTRRDLLRLIPTDPDRVVVTPLAADPAFHGRPSAADVARVREQMALPERFLIAVATLEPRKNLVRLIAAFERIHPRHPDVRLLLVGGRGWRDDAIRGALERSSARAAIEATGYVDFDDLRVLYSEALALCYPSLYEGFGLPVVEAMAAATPVLTSRGSSLDEAAGGAAVLIDPLDVGQIADGMERLVSDGDLREDLRQRGLLRAAELSWQRTAERTRAVFEDVAAGRCPQA